MSYVLFHVATGTYIKSYATEEGARIGMRTSNRNAGWERVSRSWTDGYECEWCTNGRDERYAPYGITEWDRWNERFNPSSFKIAV